LAGTASGDLPIEALVDQSLTPAKVSRRMAELK